MNVTPNDLVMLVGEQAVRLALLERQIREKDLLIQSQQQQLWEARQREAEAEPACANGEQRG